VGAGVALHASFALTQAAVALAILGPRCNSLWQWLSEDIRLPHLLFASLEAAPRSTAAGLLLHSALPSSGRPTEALFTLAPDTLPGCLLLLVFPRFVMLLHLATAHLPRCPVEAFLGCAFLVHSAVAQRRASVRLQEEQRRLLRSTARALAGGRENSRIIVSKLLQLTAAFLGLLDIVESLQFGLTIFSFDYFLSKPIVRRLSLLLPSLIPPSTVHRPEVSCLALFEVVAVRSCFDLLRLLLRNCKITLRRFRRRHLHAPRSTVASVPHQHEWSRGRSSEANEHESEPAGDEDSSASPEMHLANRSYAAVFGSELEEDEAEREQLTESSHDDGPITTATLVQKLKQWAINAAGRSDVPAGGWPPPVDVPNNVDPPVSHFYCPITRAPMKNAAVAVPSGNSFERDALKLWVSKHGTEPLTREPLDTEHIVPNRALHRQIDDWAASVRERRRRAQGGVLTWLDFLQVVSGDDEAGAGNNDDDDPDDASYEPQNDEESDDEG